MVGLKRALSGALVLLALLAAVDAGAAAVGEVSVLKGSATRIPPQGQPMALKRGDRIYEGDRVETKPRSFVFLTFDDRTRFNLGPSASFRVDTVRDGEDAAFSAEVLRGAFRFVTGLIAKHRPRSMRIKTGVVATIGIRGTSVGGEVEGESATIVLLESEDPESASAIEVGNAHGSVVIDKSGYGTRVPDRNSPPSPPARMTLRTIENLVRNINNIQRNAAPRPMLR